MLFFTAAAIWFDKRIDIHRICVPIRAKCAHNKRNLYIDCQIVDWLLLSRDSHCQVVRWQFAQLDESPFWVKPPLGTSSQYHTPH